MNKSYPFKVWITSLCIGSLFMVISLLVEVGGSFHPALIVLYCYLLLVGAIISTPVLFLYYLACKEFVSYEFSETKQRLLLSFVAIGGMWLTLCIIMGQTVVSTKEEWGIMLPTCYSFAIILSSLVFKLRSN